MTAYLSFEWLKLTKRWMPRIIVVLLLGLDVVFFWGQGTRPEDLPNLVLPRAWLITLVVAAFFAPFFWPVLGGSWAGNEYGWGTVRMFLTRRPYRVRHVFATLAILLLGIGAALVAVMLVGTAAGLVVAALTKTSSFPAGVFDATFVLTVLKSFLAAWYVSAFYLILAYAAATIFRSAAVGIGIGIGSTLAEFVMRGIFFELGGTWRDIANHFPVMYTNDLARLVAAPALAPGTGLAQVDPQVPDGLQSILVLGGYIVLLIVITILALRRDVTA
jgi:hypothetical protein